MAISLTLLGTGGPRPDGGRSQTAMLVDVDGQRILVDCGYGAVRRIIEADVAVESISTLIFTHLHVDHTFDYAPFVYAAWFHGRQVFDVFGPVGTSALTHDLFERTYLPEIGLRVREGRLARAAPTLNVREFDPQALSLEMDGFRLRLLRVIHNAPSATYALRIEDREGHVLAISSDTAYCEALAQFAEGADLLVHESYLCGPAYDRLAESFRQQLLNVHSSPEQAGTIAQLAGAKRLVLNHLFVGAVDDAAIAQRARSRFAGPIAVGRDLMSFRIPDR